MIKLFLLGWDMVWVGNLEYFRVSEYGFVDVCHHFWNLAFHRCVAVLHVGAHSNLVSDTGSASLINCLDRPAERELYRGDRDSAMCACGLTVVTSHSVCP